ncbi:MAG: PP0621 family protein [Burkholderiales bacterium]
MKYLVILVVVLVVFWIWRSGRDSLDQSARDRQAKAGPAKGQAPRLEMVRCEVCGVHLPEAEAVRAEANYYCSVEHLNQAQRN